MSEELAISTYGADNLEVYISQFKPLEWALNHEEHDGVAVREDNSCYTKLITHLTDKERVVGFHYVGPNAGEITQGFAVALKLGATKADFDGRATPVVQKQKQNRVVHASEVCKHSDLSEEITHPESSPLRQWDTPFGMVYSDAIRTIDVTV